MLSLNKSKIENVGLNGKLLILIFFIFNCVFLPAPLLWINFLSVFYFIKIINSKSILILIGYVFLLGVFAVIHFYNGVDHFESYRNSSLIYILVAYTAVIARLYFVNNPVIFETFYRSIVKYNFVLYMVGLVLFLLDIPSKIFVVYHYGTAELPRMRGLLYEPSFYAYILTPWIIYAMLKNIKNKARKSDLKYFLLLVIPFVSTVSIGVISALFLALSIVGVLRVLGHMKLKKKVVFITTAVFFALIITVLLNSEVILTRVVSIFSGEDGSANQRTIGSLDVAYQIMKEKSTWFGIGSGQIKITGKEIFNNYFNYPDWNIPRIPNAIGETMTIFGFVGLAIRLFIQFIIFIKFKVHKNNYLFTLFLFLFIYQFTGSFITSTIEYFFWLLITVPAFREFNSGYNQS